MNGLDWAQADVSTVDDFFQAGNQAWWYTRGGGREASRHASKSICLYSTMHLRAIHLSRSIAPPLRMTPRIDRAPKFLVHPVALLLSHHLFC